MRLNCLKHHYCFKSCINFFFVSPSNTHLHRLIYCYLCHHVPSPFFCIFQIYINTTSGLLWKYNKSKTEKCSLLQKLSSWFHIRSVSMQWDIHSSSILNYTLLFPSSNFCYVVLIHSQFTTFEKSIPFFSVMIESNDFNDEDEIQVTIRLLFKGL